MFMLVINMGQNQNNIIAFIERYKIYILLLLPILLMAMLIPFISLQPGTTTNTTIPTVSVNTIPSTVQTKPAITSIPVIDGHDHEPIDASERNKIQNEEILQNGIIKYTMQSHNAQRPNIRLVSNENVLFKRVVISPDFPLVANGFNKLYGNPERIIQGSLFYGDAAQTQIYGQIGVANIVNPQTNLVLEQHIFLPMDADEYIKNYGDDISR